MNKQLKTKREEAGLTQVQIAKKTKITETGYQNYEYGKREPGVRTAIQIARTLGTTVETLWGGNPTEEKPGGNQCRVGSSERPTR